MSFILTDVAGENVWTGIKGGEFASVIHWEDVGAWFKTREDAEKVVKAQRRKGICLVVRTADETTQSVLAMMGFGWAVK